MNIVVMILLIGGCVIAQGTLPQLAIFGYSPVPAVQALVLYYALVRKPWMLLVVALGGGILVDALSVGVQIGVSTFCFAIAGVLATQFRHLVFSDSIVTAAVFGAIAAMVINVVIYIMLLNEGLTQISIAAAGLKMVGVGVLAGVISPLVFLIARALDRMVGNIEYQEEFDGENQPI